MVTRLSSTSTGVENLRIRRRTVREWVVRDRNILPIRKRIEVKEEEVGGWRREGLTKHRFEWFFTVMDVRR